MASSSFINTHAFGGYLFKLSSSFPPLSYQSCTLSHNFSCTHFQAHSLQCTSNHDDADADDPMTRSQWQQQTRWGWTDATAMWVRNGEWQWGDGGDGANDDDNSNWHQFTHIWRSVRYSTHSFFFKKKVKVLNSLTWSWFLELSQATRNNWSTDWVLAHQSCNSARSTRGELSLSNTNATSAQHIVTSKKND